MVRRVVGGGRGDGLEDPRYHSNVGIIDIATRTVARTREFDLTTPIFSLAVSGDAKLVYACLWRTIVPQSATLVALDADTLETKDSFGPILLPLSRIFVQ